MYRCIKHNKIDSEWCEECQELIKCDCSERSESRFKDLTLNCENGEKTVTVYIEHCNTCGETFGIRLK